MSDDIQPGVGSDLPIVAIGASAGGLKQITAFLGALPDDTGAAYVVLQHLSSERPSQLPELLERASRLPVVTITDGMTLDANRVHVLPENSVIRINADVFQLSVKQVKPSPTVIDDFLYALAETQGPSSTGIILSGSGDDGALGLRALKRAGGLTLVQDPDTAEHPSMPRSAIESTSPDYVLATVALVEPLCNHLRNNLAKSAVVGQNVDPENMGVDDEALASALRALRARYPKRDFSSYKPSMLKRRMQRRMGLVGARSNADYLRLLESDEQECRDLSQDFLISVTDFFRDTDAFAVLCDQVLPTLLVARDPSDTVRVWVPGCATGEEAYSLAIAIDEAIQNAGKDLSFIVFASDIDARALEKARNGLYPASIATTLSTRQLRLYFDKVDDHYRIKRALRERVVFAAQNLNEDPPYSRLDLISCRNLLMYLQVERQQRVISTFHFALKPRGVLFLGASETLSGQIDLFEPIDKATRVYRRIGSPQTARTQLPFANRRGKQAPNHQAPRAAYAPHVDDPEQIARDILLREFVPASVLVTRKLEILCSYGPTGDFLTLPFGASSLALMDMVRSEYRSQTRAITHRAFRDDAAAEVSTAPHDDADHIVRITARPLHSPDSARGLAFVTFERIARTPTTAITLAGSESERQLADELDATRNELNTTIQALEASNEDLKGSNEEVLSMNEELQSTNEELETSKEELQSVNEELTTVNAELEGKVSELETAQSDLQNLFAGTNVATLFLDKGLCIKRFTPAIKDLLNLIASDIGRPLSDISLKFDDPDLADDVERSMTHLLRCDKQVRAGDGRWYQRRVLPYRTQSNVIDGVVITFADITLIKTASIQSAESERRLDLAMGAIEGGMWDMYLSSESHDNGTPDHVYLSARLKEMLGFADDQFPDSLQAWEERVVESDRAAFRDIERRRAAGANGLNYRIRHRDGGIRWFASYGTLLDGGTEQPARWIGIDRDITQQRLTNVHAARARAQLELLANAVPDMVAYTDIDGRFQFVNEAFGRVFDRAPAEIAGQRLDELFDDMAYAEIAPCLQAAIAGRNASCHIKLATPDGDMRELRVNHVPHRVDGHTHGLYLLLSASDPGDGRIASYNDKRRGLVHLQRMATIGEMTSTLAHDIKQPLSAVNNYASAIKRMVHAGREADEISSTLDKIGEQVQHANDMVSLTGNFAVESHFDQSEPIDINALVHRAVSLTEDLARNRHVDIQLDLFKPLPLLQCIAVQIEQVIINLMVNAVDAMDNSDRAERRLVLRTRPVEDQSIELSVSDNGEGIPIEKLGRIFDAFYTSKMEGTGLGLSLSRSIIESHGGTIWADSQLDMGATFFFRLSAKAPEHRS